MIEEISKEYYDIVNEICEKYNYDSEDREGNDSLRTVLLKLLPAMLKDAKPEDKELFYKMLRHTPIIITENLTKEGYDKLVEQYIGDINLHIIKEDKDIGEYGKSFGSGAYVSAPILDQDMQLQGKKSFIYIQKVDEIEFFGTDINVSHLGHELGHAWKAEHNQYVMGEDGNLISRIGTAQFIYSFSKREDGKFVQILERVFGLITEEAMNTVEEEKATAQYMGKTLEEIKSSCRIPLVNTPYKGYISDIIEHMQQELPKEDFETWRTYGDIDSKEKIESMMSKTKYWKQRGEDILPNSDNPRNYSKKRELLFKMKHSDIQEFFEENEEIYFPDISQMTPLDKIENVLRQVYEMNAQKHHMTPEQYGELLNYLGWEVYPLINQTADLMKIDELKNTIGNVRLSEVNDVVQKTKALVRQGQQILEGNAEEKGENI